MIDPAESTSTFSTGHLLLGSHTLKGNVYPSQPRPTREPALAGKASCPAWPLQGTHFPFPKNTTTFAAGPGCSQVAPRALLLFTRA